MKSLQEERDSLKGTVKALKDMSDAKQDEMASLQNVVNQRESQERIIRNQSNACKLRITHLSAEISKDKIDLVDKTSVFTNLEAEKMSSASEYARLQSRFDELTRRRDVMDSKLQETTRRQKDPEERLSAATKAASDELLHLKGEHDVSIKSYQQADRDRVQLREELEAKCARLQEALSREIQAGSDLELLRHSSSAALGQVRGQLATASSIQDDLK